MGKWRCFHDLHTQGNYLGRNVMKSFYRKGDKMVMTKEAIDQGLNSGNRRYPPTTTGVVSAYLLRDSQIKILRDGRTSPTFYSLTFWTLA